MLGDLLSGPGCQEHSEHTQKILQGSGEARKRIHCLPGFRLVTRVKLPPSPGKSADAWRTHQPAGRLQKNVHRCAQAHRQAGEAAGLGRNRAGGGRTPTQVRVAGISQPATPQRPASSTLHSQPLRDIRSQKCRARNNGLTNALGCFFFFNKFIYLFLAVLGLRCCARAFSSCSKRGLLFVVVRGLLIAVASLVAEHGL